jgi:2-octaprenylphenol hydroxylase
VVIVGGGMVGAALACLLSDSPLSVAIVEGNPPPLSWPEESHDLRVSAVSRTSQRILETLGVWKTIRALRATPYYHMHVWDSQGDGLVHFDCDEVGETTLGHIVENRVIQRALYEHLSKSTNVQLLYPVKPRAMMPGADGYLINLDSGERITAKLLVGADGARSWVRQQAGIPVDTHDYAQKAVVATVKTEKYHQDTAWQIFLPTGPLAFLPLDDGYSSIVWSTTLEQAHELSTMDDKEFSAVLQKAFQNTLGEITYTSERGAFPLRSMHAKHYVKDSLALIGDAAHTIHPLAGQGVNLGFADAAALAQVLLEADQKRQAPGALKVLRRYERWRKGENLAMLSAMSGFNALFGSKHPLVRFARNQGFKLTDKLTPVKNLFIRHAMGLSGELPRAARPGIRT